MSRRFIELAVRARRFVMPPERSRAVAGRSRATGRRQVGAELTQFSFRLALMIDLAYVGVGALGGAALGGTAAADWPRIAPPESTCSDSRPGARAAPALADSAAAPNDDSVVPPAATRRLTPSRTMR